MARYEARHAADASHGRQKARAPKKRVPKKKRGHRVLRGIVGTVAGVAVAAGLAYGAGLYYFRDHFLPNTTVNGRDVSLMSEDEVATQIASNTDGYTSTVTAGDFSYTVRGADIDLKTDGATAASDALAQVDLARWPLLALRGSTLNVREGVSYDQKKLEDAVGSAVDAFDAKATQPQDATWTYDAGTFNVKPDVPGTAVDKDAVVKAAVAGVDGLSPSTACDDSAKVRAQRTADDPTLKAAVDKANQIASSSIALTYNGKQKAQVSKERIAQWVSIGDDLSVNVDKDAIASYVANTVAPAVNSEDDDNTYTVKKGDLTSELASAAEQGAGGTLEVPVATKAKPKKAQEASEGQGSDQGSQDGSSAEPGTGSSLASTLGSYIDVDLGNQRATYYDASGKVLWQSSIVSGNESEGRSTPTGTYQINDKETNQTLVGADENGDGEPDYKSHVNYWMPFVGNSVGLHDATWRGTFGGSVYESSGSHGCVNLPYAKAAELYAMVPVGTTVYVHH